MGLTKFANDKDLRALRRQGVVRAGDIYRGGD
jgi:hypothetical protein